MVAPVRSVYGRRQPDGRAGSRTRWFAHRRCSNLVAMAVAAWSRVAHAAVSRPAHSWRAGVARGTHARHACPSWHGGATRVLIASGRRGTQTFVSRRRQHNTSVADTVTTPQVPESEACPLCRASAASGALSVYHTKRWRSFSIDAVRAGDRAKRHVRYFQCCRCRLVFLGADYWLDAPSERTRYEMHENDFSDGYVAFLQRFVSAIEPWLPAAGTGVGVDYGCGPLPRASTDGDRRRQTPAEPMSVLATLLSDDQYGHRHSMTCYDPFFAPQAPRPPHSFDFVVATEVAEHLHRPAAVLREMVRLADPSHGAVALMTSFLPDDVSAFGDWYYHQDPTHVTFHSQASFSWVARHVLHCSVAFPADGVAVLHSFERAAAHATDTAGQPATHA